MFATYAYKAGATAAQIAADLAALVCGANLAALSAGCNKDASSIGGEAPGWAAFDGTYNVCKGVDASGVDKFMRLLVSGSDVQATVCESWNSATHVAVNAVTAQKIITVSASGGVVYVVANQENVVFWPGDSSSWLYVSEIGRDSPLLPAGYPVICLGYSTYPANIYLPRFKNTAAAGDVTNSNLLMRYAMGNVNMQPRAPGEVLYWQLMPLVAAAPSNQVFYGYMRGMFLAPASQTGGRLVDTGGAEHVQLYVDASTCYAVERK